MREEGRRGWCLGRRGGGVVFREEGRRGWCLGRRGGGVGV